MKTLIDLLFITLLISSGVHAEIKTSTDYGGRTLIAGKASNVDSLFSIQNNLDATKLLGLDLSGETTAKSFVLAPQNTSNMTVHFPQVATAAGAGMALVQDETTGFIFSSGITSTIGGANSMMQLANATTANRAQIKLHSYYNGASVAGVSTLTSRSGTIAVNAAIGASQDYSKWTAQASPSAGAAPIVGTWAFKSAATGIGGNQVPSDYHIQLMNQAGTLVDRLYLTSEGVMTLPGATGTINMGSVDAFGRGQIWNAMANASMRLGALAQDGDPTDVNAEGIVVYGANSQGTPINSATGNFGYARIKADRIGLLTSISNVQNYYFRADPTEMYMKDDSGTKTFDVTRSSGLLYSTGGLQIKTSTAQPTCDSSTRGLLWNIQGGAGVADILQICQKNAADVYVWVTK